MKLRLFLLSILLTLAACSSEVAVGPQVSSIASFKRNPITRSITMSGDVKGTIDTVFHASNRALDDLKYYRTEQDTTNKDEDLIYARGPMDVAITVDITPSTTKDASGVVNLSITLSSGSLPDAQTLYAATLKELP